MFKSSTIAAKAVLGAALVAFCGILIFYAFGIGDLPYATVEKVASCSAVLIVFMALLVLPRARRRDEARNRLGNAGTLKPVDGDKGRNAIRMGSAMLALSVVLFVCVPTVYDSLPRAAQDALSFVSVGLLFFGALYLVAGIRSRSITPK